MKITLWIFGILLIVITSDLNGFVSGMFNTSGLLSGFIFILTTILLIASLGFRSIRLPMQTKYFIFLIVFWLVFGIVLYFIYNPGYGSPFGRVRYYLPSLLLFYTISIFFLYYIKSGNFSTIFNLITVALVLNCVFIIFSDYIGTNFNVEVDEGRSSGFAASVNQAGVTSSFSQILVLYHLLISPKTKRNQYILLLAYIITVYAAYLTFSKAAFLNIVFNLVIFLFFLARLRSSFKLQLRNIQRLRISVLLVFLFIFFTLWMNTTIFSENLTREQSERLEEFSLILKGEINDETSTGRTHIARIVYQEAKMDNFLGRGLSTFHNQPATGGYGTHNQFLLFLGELGLWGLFFYLLFFVLLLKEVLKKYVKNEIKYLIIALCTVFIITSVSSHNVFFIKVFIILFALLCVLPEYSKTLINKHER